MGESLDHHVLFSLRYTATSGKSFLNVQRLKHGSKLSHQLLVPLRFLELPTSVSDKKHPKQADGPPNSGSLLHLPSRAGPGQNCKAGRLRSF